MDSALGKVLHVDVKPKLHRIPMVIEYLRIGPEARSPVAHQLLPNTDTRHRCSSSRTRTPLHGGVTPRNDQALQTSARSTQSVGRELHQRELTECQAPICGRSIEIRGGC